MSAPIIEGLILILVEIVLITVATIMKETCRSKCTFIKGIYYLIIYGVAFLIIYTFMDTARIILYT